jgi:hypothetical protein
MRSAVGARPRAAVLTAALGIATLVAGCSGSSSGGTPTGNVPAPADFPSFLQLPVATPASCAPHSNGTTSGRRSPWVGRIDVSLFVHPGTTNSQLRRLASTVLAMQSVRTVYVESAQQAYAEFQRLYTCSANVSPDQVPASLRIRLFNLNAADREKTLHQLVGLPHVDSLSCDPSNPCTDVSRPTPTASPG